MDFVIWFILFIFTGVISVVAIASPWVAWYLAIDTIRMNTWWPSWLYWIQGIMLATIPLAFNLWFILNASLNPVTAIVIGGPMNLDKSFEYYNAVKRLEAAPLPKCSPN